VASSTRRTFAKLSYRMAASGDVNVLDVIYPADITAVQVVDDG
jgi:hypothetical protein